VNEINEAEIWILMREEEEDINKQKEHKCVEVNAKTDNVTKLCCSPWRGESMLPLIPKIP
jgi:hypothetical protein